jgi:hypothetical protein
MKLSIGDRAALLTHPGLAECWISLEQSVVLFALRDIALRRPGWRNITGADLRSVGYQAGSNRWWDILAPRGIGSRWGAIGAVGAWWGAVGAVGARGVAI